ncbi:MAG: hypothetical protein EXS17_06715 [Phycisphaerales bacterium]|nr:hypothetical protein [Phycisphaerales bacterium]
MSNHPIDRRGLHLALAFATSVFMWAIGYVAMMRPGVVAGEVLFALMFVALILGGFVAGRLSVSSSPGAGFRAGALVGVLSATVNLLIVGSLFGSDTQASVWTQLVNWVGGLYGASIVCGAIGGAIGGRGTRWKLRFPVTSLFGWVTAATIFLLLITGGLVTGLEAGLAVPDWPNSFGHNMLLYPLSEMKGGIYYEHAHRLYGMLVGVSAVTLLVLIMRFESAGLVRALAIIGVLIVIVQGLMGALRVTGNFTLSQDAADLAPSTSIGVAHGIFGQIVFALYCWIAVLCGARWKSPATQVAGETGNGRSLSTVLIAFLFVQLLSGAIYRHYQVPVVDGPATYPKWAMHLHLSWSVVVFVMSLLVGLRAMRFPKSLRPLPQLGHGILMLVGLQFALGIGAFVFVITRKSLAIPTGEIIFTTMHQATGALLFATSVLLAVWWRRLTVLPSST